MLSPEILWALSFMRAFVVLQGDKNPPGCFSSFTVGDTQRYYFRSDVRSFMCLPVKCPHVHLHAPSWMQHYVFGELLNREVIESGYQSSRPFIFHVGILSGHKSWSQVNILYLKRVHGQEKTITGIIVSFTLCTHGLFHSYTSSRRLTRDNDIRV